MTLRLAAALCPLVVVTAVLGAPGTAAAAGLELRLSFDSGERLAPGGRVVDTSGKGRHGAVRTANGGRITRVTGWQGSTSARFPGSCSGGGCPKAIVQVPSSSGLVLGYAPFEWGARVRLSRGATSAGQNLVQKGLYTDPAGQWKLQVDGEAGRPSCVVSGSRGDGSYERVTVPAAVSVADGTWHQVTCRRTRSAVVVLVDGRAVGSRAMRPVRLGGKAPVRIGGKRVDQPDSDQFFGTLDQVVVRRF